MVNQNLPTHIALIPDGNRRWAHIHGLPTLEGHRRGFKRVVELGEKIRELNIQTFTVWAFSTENWKRDQKEVDYLMKIYVRWINQYLKTALKDKIRIIHLGRKDRLPTSLYEAIADAEKKTAQFDTYFLAVALDYGGQDEIVRAIQKIKQSKLKAEDLQEQSFEQFLDTKNLPNPAPDLIIRTSGEQRSSGFLTWQSAYSEYIFHKKHLPDFTTKDLMECIQEYQNRQRRFGK